MNSKQNEKEKALKRLNEYGNVPHGQWLVRLFFVLVPRSAHLVLIGMDGVMAFIPLADVISTDRNDFDSTDRIGIHLRRVDDRHFILTATVCDGYSGSNRILFTVVSELDPPSGFHVAQRVNFMKFGRSLDVGHIFTLIEQNMGDGYGQWLVETALPAIIRHCLDTSRLFTDT